MKLFSGKVTYSVFVLCLKIPDILFIYLFISFWFGVCATFRGAILYLTRVGCLQGKHFTLVWSLGTQIHVFLKEAWKSDFLKGKLFFEEKLLAKLPSFFYLKPCPLTPGGSSSNDVCSTNVFQKTSASNCHLCLGHKQFRNARQFSQSNICLKELTEKSHKLQG